MVSVGLEIFKYIQWFQDNLLKKKIILLALNCLSTFVQNHVTIHMYFKQQIKFLS